jgi:DNA-binding CsgD family transcriptional regulator
MNGDFEKLSKRQKQCVKLFADGETRKAIRDLFGLSSLNTVYEHITIAKRALGITSDVLLIKWAIRNQISPL